MDAAADDGMRLWTALKREIDITLPSARSHAEDQLKTKTKQKHDETARNSDYAFAGAHANSRTAARIALELLSLPDPTTTTRSSYPTSSVAPTNARPYTIVSYAQIQKTADAALHYPCKGAAVAVTAAVRVARGGRNTERFDPQRHNRRCQNANCPAPHTHDTPMCYAPGGTRHDPARWRGNTDAGRGGRGGRGGYQGGRGGRGGRHPLQYTPQPQHYTPQQHQNFQQLGGAYTTYPAYPVLATDASHHGIGGTQQYLPPPPPLPSRISCRTTLHE
ncbi:hypothetical protein RI054_08g40810 [Pseudoscourfieldia marina]